MDGQNGAGFGAGGTSTESGSMRPDIERAVAEQARSQLGLITRPQARAAGLSNAAIRRRVARGTWSTVGRQTYLAAPIRPSPEVEVLAAALDLDGVASHRTAAWLHDLLPRPAVIDITVPKGRSADGWTGATPVRVHTSTSMPPEDVTEVGGIPTFSIARTALGLTALGEDEVPAAAVTTFVEEAVRRRLATDTWFWWLLERRRCRGRNGVTRLEAVLATRAELGPTESWLERELLRVLAAAGLPLPVVQRRIGRRGHFVARVDAAYEPGKIVIEALGYDAHATRRQQDRDAERASELQLLGYDVHQFTYTHVTQRPAWVASVVRRALEHAGVLPSAA